MNEKAPVTLLFQWARLVSACSGLYTNSTSVEFTDGTMLWLLLRFYCQNASETFLKIHEQLKAYGCETILGIQKLSGLSNNLLEALGFNGESQTEAQPLYIDHRAIIMLLVYLSLRILPFNHRIKV